MRLFIAVARSSAMARPLKVFRTPIGFHDAYIAVPSQKAALAAWGTDANLFARGGAERVTDPALTAEPLAHPGKVIKRPRASAAEHFAALAQPVKKDAAVRQKDSHQARHASKPKPPPKPHPRPSRAKLDSAEQALADQQRRAEAELVVLEQEQARIAAQIERMRDRLDKETSRLERQIERARQAHDAALARWRAS